ncbi:hypothetical protein DPMN_190674 [Dreissena polymorpha]|uniref:Uncharacterized protein n=1 Tax=Dreissena polymorpha TaxID=45954 RepID=A0A9D3Y130_DREPO|nr:hypothetical protein DPMN_190674 [Dreissena polymorpha]
MHKPGPGFNQSFVFLLKAKSHCDAGGAPVRDPGSTGMNWGSTGMNRSPPGTTGMNRGRPGTTGAPPGEY